MGGYEILEHTADVGVRAWGHTLEETFEQAAQAMAEIIGVWDPQARGEPERLVVEGGDLGALLVDFLSELIYRHDTYDAVLAGVRVASVAQGRVDAAVAWTPRGARTAEGTQVKAVTYHRLRVERSGRGWVADVYLDV
jgi:SHS2 domain-containing protein